MKVLASRCEGQRGNCPLDKEYRVGDRKEPLFWLLLVYQWILVLVSLGYSFAFATVIVEDMPDWNIALALSALLILACWGIAMGFASIGIMRRRPRGFLLGMICHLVLAIPGLLFMVSLGCQYVVLSFSQDNESRGWAGMFLIFALMWLPFVAISAWAFFYLCGLRNRLFS